MASKRKILCMDQKVAIIRAIEQGKNKSVVGKTFGLSHSTVSGIWQSKEKILEAAAKGSSLKKLKKPKYEVLDRTVIEWYQTEQASTPMSGPKVQAKAEYFAKQLKITEFKASEGWLGKFKRRHCINFSQRGGGTQDIEMEATTSVENVWLNTEKDANDSNVDETETSDTLKIKEECNEDSDCTDLEDKELTPATLSDSDEEIQSTVIKDEQNLKENKVSDDSPPTLQQALDALKILEKFLLFQKRVFQ